MQAHNVTDFAYGQPEFNEMLDTANVKKAESLHRKHSQRQHGGSLVPGVRSQVPEAEGHEDEELTGEPLRREIPCMKSQEKEREGGRERQGGRER
jgi:hypothetical protein